MPDAKRRKKLGKPEASTGAFRTPYPGFLANLVDRFEQELSGIKAHHNFEFGAEFEIAVCNVLRAVLPGRVGVCRGYVLGVDGTTAGDDIVLFDANRFPTLRLLGTDLSRKEQVPADAVLAYIEAKHTLRVGGTGRQSLAKALTQIAAVKAIYRSPLGLNVVDNVNLSTLVPSQEPGWPGIRNPLPCAIWAPHVDTGDSSETPEVLLGRLEKLVGSLEDPKCADVVAAGSLLASPATIMAAGKRTPRPFLTQGCELVGSRHASRSLGLAAFHLLWAIEWIRLRAMPWEVMLGIELQRSQVVVKKRGEG